MLIKSPDSHILIFSLLIVKKMQTTKMNNIESIKKSGPDFPVTTCFS